MWGDPQEMKGSQHGDESPQKNQLLSVQLLQKSPLRLPHCSALCLLHCHSPPGDADCRQEARASVLIKKINR